VLAGGAAALGPQIVGASSLYAYNIFRLQAGRVAAGHEPAKLAAN